MRREQALSGRAAELIAALELTPHPEGGHYREIHRSAATVQPSDGRPQRAALTTIYFLLRRDEVSRWHRVASDEAWHFIEGDALAIYEADASLDRVATIELGLYGEERRPAHVVTANTWQAARTTGEFTLVACTVAPGFDFADFALLRTFPDELALLEQKQPHLIAFV